MILQIYPDALAQAVYAAFVEAFPESIKEFNDDFKQKLVHTLHEWMSGTN